MLPVNCISGRGRVLSVMISVPHPALADFHPAVRTWFLQTYGEPSPPQQLGWPSIASGQHTLILAPTGSGKTLAAFLWAINHLVEQRVAGDDEPGVRILYVSPLKALNNDIERNLEHPLSGIMSCAQESGFDLPAIRTAVRTGDTTQSRRISINKKPPDILITTPESLYLMLTSKNSRKIFRSVQYVIVDEIHSLCGNKRGVHLSVSLERLAAVAETEFIRVGLSATQRPLEEIARFLGGQTNTNGSHTPRPVNIVDAGQRKEMDLRVECAAPDFALLPQESVWPLVFTELLELIRTHRTTLVFVNNRRLAERVAAKLNELITGNGNTFNLYAVPHGTDDSSTPSPRDSDNPILHHSNDPATRAGETPASDSPGPILAYHGSMSRQAREQMEQDLKSGRLRCLVTTSALELGIDIGSVDLVVQVQSPKGVARGLQRVGRSGHLINATSKGRIYPTHRADLVESAVVARSMRIHDVELTTIPKDCLDVLAQQIVAMVSVEEWDVDSLYDLIRQSYCYAALPQALYTGVLEMLAGRYTHEAFRELRARISWDKVNSTLRALPGSSQLATTSGGTISDRGYFGVYLEDGKTRVGEVDEEFVYESRAGDTFILGTSVWRMLNIDANRITVVSAPGQPARMPFWRGEGIGRSYELGQKVGEFRRTISPHLDDPGTLARLQHEFPVDTRAAWNILEYLRKQREVAGIVPHDRLFVMEGFRDEIGDPRIILHSPFGRRVNGLLGLVLVRRLHNLIAAEPQMLYNDDGILLRCPDMDELPLDLLDNITVKEAEEIVLNDLLSSPLFGGQFRQNAARALLMPRIAPGKRTPLWLQRLRAKDLLQIARQVNDFPIVIETVREVLNDVLDFEHFKELIRGVENGTIAVRTVRTEVPSPFAASLLFDFIAVYMYEWDQPREDRMSQYLAINRELLSEVVDLESMHTLLRPEAIEAVERQLQHTAEGYRARSPEELLEILLRVGDLTSDEVAARCGDGALAMLSELSSNGRSLPVQLAGEDRWIAGEEQALYQSLEDKSNAVTVLRRYIQSRGPVTEDHITRRFGWSGETVSALLKQLSSREPLVQGRFVPSTEDQGGRQWCYKPTIERIHRATLGILRREIKPCSFELFTEFLLHWQHLHPATQETGAVGMEECVAMLQGIPLHAEIWEREILARRIRGYSSALPDELTRSGRLVWVGAGAGKARMVSRGEGHAFLPSPSPEVEASFGDPAHRILAYLRTNGASFLNDIRSGTNLSLAATNDGIAELFWSGLITNDVMSEVMGVKRSARSSEDVPVERITMLDPHHNPGRPRMMQSVRRAIKQTPGWNGRWSLVHLPGVMGESISIEAQATAQALQLLQRYGILAREFARREDLLPWPQIASALQRMELRGEIRRGYFVQGLSGMQYGLPAAVAELRRLMQDPRSDSTPLLINSCDPANPLGIGLFSTSAQSGIKLSRFPGNYVAFLMGTPVLTIESYGARLWTHGDPDKETLLAALQSFVGMMKLPATMRPFKSITVEYCNDLRPTQSPMEPLLKYLGFLRDSNQKMRLDTF